MGEVSQLKVSVPKPRPLGLVKRESVHFDDVDCPSPADVQLFSGAGVGGSASGKHQDSWTGRAGPLAFLGRSKTESDIKHEFRSMRDLQETLRQAALLNIVAAVNHDESPLADGLPVVATHQTGTSGTTTTTTGHFVGIKGASILGHPIIRHNNNNNKPFAAATSTSTGEGTGISITNFSHNLSSAAHTHHHHIAMPVASHNSTLSQLLGQRPRTISIPRPRTQTEQGSFMHKSLLDAKEQLSNVTTFRAKSRREMDAPITPHAAATAPSTQDNTTTNPAVEETTGANSAIGNNTESRNNNSNNNNNNSNEIIREVSCLRGTGFDVGDSGQQNKHGKESITQNHTTKDNSNNNHNEDIAAAAPAAAAAAAKLSKEQQRAQNVHQMQAMKRHITTNKKKELMKKLTDIAKCDAVDMAEPLSSANAISAPPIIIMSQQKENVPLYSDDLDTRVNRTKSMTSLQGRNENAKVPSNTRIQSETLESMAQHREAKRNKSVLNVDEDLRIESINGIDSSLGVDGFYRTQRDQKAMDMYDDHVYFSHDPRMDHMFSDGIIGKNVNSTSFSPDVLELRPLDGVSNFANRITLTERRRPQTLRRVANQNMREKLISPSPAVYEASFHRPKASTIQMTLVGQSLPALSGPKTPAPSANPNPVKPITKRTSSDEAGAENRTDDYFNKIGGENRAAPLKHWGSVGKLPSANSPILRTEIVDHLQCVGLVNHRQLSNNVRKSFSKVNNSNNKIYEHPRPSFDYDDEEYFDDDDSSGTPPATKNTVKYRKSKLYNAFRASEENLSTLADNTSLVSEVMTSRTLLNLQPSTAVVEEPVVDSARDPVNQSPKEPLYMGCSSRVSEKELRSQYHYVNDGTAEEEDNSKQNGQFKVMKAIDQDVYFDFQHKKYRKNAESALNTASNNPRMHFLKIKFGGEAAT